MKHSIKMLSVALTMFATNAMAQGVDLSGRYQCVQLCRPGFETAPAYVTQNGWNLNVIDEAGDSSRAWVDWPGHIWVPNWPEGATFSPDGVTIHFVRGRIWHRAVEVEPPPPLPENVQKKQRGFRALTTQGSVSRLGWSIH
jgi:hypothetical protein